MTAILDAYRRHPARLLVAALAVFLPLGVPRFFLVEAAWFPAAIALNVAGHVVLAAILRRRREPLPPTGGVGAPVLALVLLTGLEIVVGRGLEALFGTSSLVVTLGGTVPAILVGPAWALVLVGVLATRAPTRPDRPRAGTSGA